MVSDKALLDLVLEEIKRRDEAILTLTKNKEGCEYEFNKAKGLYEIFASELDDGSDSKELEEANKNVWYARQERDKCIANLDSKNALNEEWRNSLIVQQKALEKKIYPMRGGGKRKRKSKGKRKSKRRVALIKKARQ